ncbi:MAG: hypothetical protein RLO52_06590 [Sandaracinaceae bacterium]|nr:hypothetical protein [Myxococcales bacterium]
MGKKKTKKDKRREQREQEAEARALALEAAKLKLKRYRVAAAVVPVVFLAAAIGVYVALDDKQLAGLIGMVGLAIWVPVLLGLIGARIQPRDRTRAGSIDFGNRR